MIYGLWLSAAGLQVNEYRQSITANNLANVETTGFKEDLAVFSSRSVESQSGAATLDLTHPILDELSGGTFVKPTYTSFEDGALQETGDPLDVAIRGEGFFVVQAGGRECLTRDGGFVQGLDGRLVNARGQAVLDDDGEPIVIPDGLAARIDDHGRVMTEQGEVARLRLVTVDDPQSLTKAGGNLFDAGHAAVRDYQAALEPGFLEGSTVEPVTLLTRSIMASRAYQMNARMITVQDEMLGRAVNDIARV